MRKFATTILAIVIAAATEYAIVPISLIAIGFFLTSARYKKEIPGSCENPTL